MACLLQETGMRTESHHSRRKYSRKSSLTSTSEKKEGRVLVISDSVSESPKRLQPLISKRLGMSYCHGAEKQVLFSLLKRTNEKAGGMGSSSCVSSLMTRVLSLGKSSHDSGSSQVLSMINLLPFAQ